MDLIEYDFNRICRACKCESSDMCSVFERNATTENNARFDEMLMACASVQINSTDGLPGLICQKCANLLTSAFQFKQQCETTDISLRDYLKSKGIKQETPQTSQSSEQDLHNQLLDFSAMYNELQAKAVEVASAGVKTDQDFPASIACDVQVQLKSNRDYVEIIDNDKIIFTCNTCSKVFYTLEGLKSHKRIHTGEMYKCNVCNKEYTRLNHLQRHMNSHSRRKVHICKICNKTLTRLEHLKRHLITHMKNKPFQCEMCKRGFNRSEHLINHTKRCKGDKIYACEVCNKGFTRTDSLEVHMHLHDNKSPILPTLETLDNIQEHYIEVENFSGKSESEHSEADNFSDQDDGADDNRDCFEPQVDILENADEVKIEPRGDQPAEEAFLQVLKSDLENFDENDNGDSDNSAHSEYLPNRSPKIKRKRGRPRKHPLKRGRKPKIEIKKEPVDEEPGEFPCDICNKVLSTAIGLEIHSRKHSGLKLHNCKVCHKKFTRSNHLKRHMIIHSENKPYSCTICPKTFSRRDHMAQHMKLHVTSKQFECELCNRPFARAEHLAKHKASKHNIGEKIMNEKKFKCTICLKGFTTEKYRDVHMRGHAGDKKHNCKTCDKTFLSKSHLTEHMKFHNEHSKKFLCSECGQRFIRNDYLVIHMRRHRGEKPFKCKYCGKGFPRTTDLTVHERYHTGEKTHLCTICGRGFGRAYNLTVHMRTHTGEKPYQCTYCDAAFAQGNDLKAHVRRHTGERFQCEICTESFLMGYLLTQHKRTVHGLHVVSHIRRLQQFPPAQPQQQIELPSVTVPLHLMPPVPVVVPSVIPVVVSAPTVVLQSAQQPSLVE